MFVFAQAAFFVNVRVFVSFFFRIFKIIEMDVIVIGGNK